MKRIWCVVVVVVLAWGSALPASAQVAAGAVARLQGEARASRDGVTRPLGLGGSLFVGDRIDTGEATRVQIRLSGGTVVTLGDRSSIVVEAPETEDRGGVLAVLEGVFLATTRAIADLGRDSLTVKTPTAVLGVRGTTVWGRQQPNHLGAAMLAGTAVVVTSPDGSVTLNDSIQGTDVRSGEAPTPPKRWGAARLNAAFAAVAFD